MHCGTFCPTFSSACSSSSSSGKTHQAARRHVLIVRAEAGCEPCSPAAAPSSIPLQRPAPLTQLPTLWRKLQQVAHSDRVQQILPSLLGSSKQQRLQVLLGAAAVPVLPAAGGSAWAQLTSNYVFCVGFWGWFFAQFLKIFTKRYKKGVWDLRAFVDSGGMPSSHSSLCSAVTTAIALQQGMSSALFAVALCFSVIVMYDAMGVRRHAGLQAEVLNVVVEDLLEDHPVSEKKLKEVLGHTPRQVICGAILGVLVGLLYPNPPGGVMLS